MIGTYNRPPKEAPNAFYGVGMDMPPYPFLCSMIDALVSSVAICDAFVGGPFVGNDTLGSGKGIVFDEPMQGMASVVVYDLQDYISTSLDRPGHNSLVAFVF